MHAIWLYASGGLTLPSLTYLVMIDSFQSAARKTLEGPNLQFLT